MLLAVGDLALLCCAAVACWVRPTRLSVWVLVICSALWLPLNNGHLEGPVLITVDPRHGLTAADLIGYGGWVLAALTLHRRRTEAGPRWMPKVGGAAALVGGVAGLYFVAP